MSEIVRTTWPFDVGLIWSRDMTSPDLRKNQCDRVIGGLFGLSTRALASEHAVSALARVIAALRLGTVWLPSHLCLRLVISSHAAGAAVAFCPVDG